MVEISPNVTLAPLLNFGALGIVVGWFMLVTTGRLDRIERAIDRMTRAMALDVIARPQVAESVREQAQQLLRELEAVAAKRSGQ